MNIQELNVREQMKLQAWTLEMQGGCTQPCSASKCRKKEENKHIGEAPRRLLTTEELGARAVLTALAKSWIHLGLPYIFTILAQGPQLWAVTFTELMPAA